MRRSRPFGARAAKQRGRQAELRTVAVTPGARDGLTRQRTVTTLLRQAVGATDLNEVCADVLDAVRQTLGVDFAQILELGPDGHELVPRWGVGWRPGTVGLGALPIDDTTLESEAAQRVGASLIRAFGDGAGVAASPLGAAHGVVSGAAVSIPGDHKPAGVLVVYSRTARDWTLTEAAFLEGVAAVLGAAFQRHAVTAVLRHSARIDPLTGLCNRTILEDRLERAAARTRGRSASVAVLAVNLDRFRRINDALGHAVGDALLVQVAERLTALVHPEDTVSRCGADEFAILVENPGSGPDTLAGHILEELRRPFHVGEHDLIVSGSVGIAIDDGCPDRAKGLLAHAETALCRAKEAGGDRLALSDENLHEEMLRRLTVERELRDALRNRELFLHYQPVFDLKTGMAIGAEALVRWHHPQRGLVPPGDFIPVAEETGLVDQIGRYVLIEAVREVVRWVSRRRDGHAPVMAVNVSARELANPNYAEEVLEILGRHGAAPGLLCLELTETSLLTQAESAIATLVRLRDSGVQIALDDFGTGFSSLSYLRRLPVSVLKIDRSFINRIAADPADSALVGAITRMGHELGMTVLAEGIETAAELAHAKLLGCDLGQGFHLARPGEGSRVLTARCDDEPRSPRRPVVVPSP